MARKRRSFSAEFKAEAVRLCKVGDRSIGQVSRDFDLTEGALREWVKRADVDAGQGPPGALTTVEREELGKLAERRRKTGSSRPRSRITAVLLRRLKLPRPSSRRRTREVRVHRGGEGAVPGAVALRGARREGQRLLRVARPPRLAQEDRGCPAPGRDQGGHGAWPWRVRQPARACASYVLTAFAWARSASSG